jgi:hypothetical protein
MHAILVRRYLAPLLQCLWYGVLACPAAFFDQVACGAVCDICLCHQRRLLAQLLRNARETGLLAYFGVAWLGARSEAVRRMVETWGGRREASLRAAEGGFVGLDCQHDYVTLE